MKAEAALSKLMNKLDAAIEANDISSMAPLFTEDALVCGTDPSEFWNKQEFMGLWEQNPADSYPDFELINDRKIALAPEGHSAVVVDQYIIELSPKIPWRQVYHCVKTNEGWLIYFMNVAFIPKNEDIKKINEAID